MLHAAFSHRRFLPSALAASFLAAPAFADPAVTATQRDSFPDVNNDNLAEIGEQIDYETVIANGGNMSATALRFFNNIPGNTSFVPNSLKSTPLAVDDSYDSYGNVGISISAPGLLANDFDLGPQAATVVPASGNTNQGGTFQVFANGSFDYDPPTGFNGSDSFTYTIQDENGANLPAPATGSNTATVDLSVVGMIWFIDDTAPAGGDGSLDAPFDTLADQNSNPNNVQGDHVFLFIGSYSGGLDLLTNQQLIGQGVTGTLDSVLNITLPPGSNSLPPTGGTRPVLGNSSGHGINLASNNTVRGLNVGTSGGNTSEGISGSNFGTLTIDEVSVNSSNGGGVGLSNGTLDVTFDSISSTGGDHGINLSSTTGSFSITGTGTTDGSGGTIQNSSDHGINLNTVSNFDIRNLNLNNGGNQDNENGINCKNITGTCRVQNCLVRGHEHAFFVDNENGTVLNELKVRGCTIENNNPQAAAAENGIHVEAFGDASITLHIDDCIFQNLFGDGVFTAGGQLRAGQPQTSHINLSVENCDFIGVHDSGGSNAEVRRAIRTGALENGTVTFDINGHTLDNQIGTAITVKNDSNGLIQGRVHDNIIDGTENNGGSALILFADGNSGTSTVNGTLRAAATNNTKSDVAGIPFDNLVQDSAGVRLELELGNNTMTNVDPGQIGPAVRFDIQSGSTGCLDTSTGNGFGNNTFLAGGGPFGGGIGVSVNNSASNFVLEGHGGGAGAAAFIDSQNPGSGATEVIGTNGDSAASGNCPSHSLPPIPLP